MSRFFTFCVDIYPLQNTPCGVRAPSLVSNPAGKVSPDAKSAFLRDVYDRQKRHIRPPPPTFPAPMNVNSFVTAGFTPTDRYPEQYSPGAIKEMRPYPLENGRSK